MQHKASKRRKRVQLTFVYLLMISAVIAGVAILVLVIQGYRFNRYDGKIEQGGLVQFDARPSGATVTVDDIQLANKTASKVTLSAGTHRIAMQREGYSTWTKTVTVKAGAVLWLNYARLFPSDPTLTTVTTYDAFSSALMSPDRKQVAVIASSTNGAVYLTPLEDDKPVTRKVVIDAGVASVPSNSSSAVFSLVAWDHDNRYLIVKHTYDDKSEYLSVDSQNGTTRNITKALGVAIERIEYSLADSNAVYMLTTSREVRRGNLSAATLSGPLLTGVADFAQADKSTLTYETVRASDGTRSVGYLTNGASKARVVRTVSDDGSISLKFRMGTYYGDRFLVVTYGDTTSISSADVPSSDSSSALKLIQKASVPTAGGVQYLGFSPIASDGRFVYAQQGSMATMYDLELGTVSKVTLQGQPSRVMDWVDGYHIGAVAGGASYYYDFDGTNGQLVTATAIDAPTVISNNAKYFYYFAPSADKVVLKRVQLIN